jgi:ABC-2 type transport system permease protein
MKAFLQHFSFEFRTGIRNRSLLFLTYLFPIMVYLLLGTLMTSVNPSFTETLIPVMCVFAVLSGTFLGLPDTLVTARQAGILRSYKINGVPASSILLAPSLATFLHLMVIMGIITISAPIVFKAPLPINWLGFGLVFILSTLACTSLAFLIGVISTSSQMTILWAQIIFLPSMLLGDLMLPTSILPKALGKIALLLPTTYAMNAFRGLAMNMTPDFDPIWSVLILLAGAILAFLLSLLLFHWDIPDASQRRRMPLALLALLPYLLGVLLL